MSYIKSSGTRHNAIRSWLCLVDRLDPHISCHGSRQGNAADRSHQSRIIVAPRLLTRRSPRALHMPRLSTCCRAQTCAGHTLPPVAIATQSQQLSILYKFHLSNQALLHLLGVSAPIRRGLFDLCFVVPSDPTACWSNHRALCTDLSKTRRLLRGRHLLV